MAGCAARNSRDHAETGSISDRNCLSEKCLHNTSRILAQAFALASRRQRFSALVEHRQIFAVGKHATPLLAGQLANDPKLDQMLE